MAVNSRLPLLFHRPAVTFAAAVCEQLAEQTRYLTANRARVEHATSCWSRVGRHNELTHT